MCSRNCSFSGFIRVFLFSIACISLPFSANAAKTLPESKICAYAKSQLKEGDLVFLDLPTKLYDKVEAVSQSWASHVGIAALNDRQQWVVYEQKPIIHYNPLTILKNMYKRNNGKPTKLCEYLQRADQGQHAILRYAAYELSRDDVSLLLRDSKPELRKYYDFGFDFDNDNKSYCSKFVFEMYRKLGISVGHIETFAGLENQIRNKRVSRGLEQWFTQFPWNYLTNNRGSVKWCRRTITPASQLRDPQFKVIYRRNQAGRISQTRDEFVAEPGLPPSERMRACTLE